MAECPICVLNVATRRLLLSDAEIVVPVEPLPFTGEEALAIRTTNQLFLSTTGLNGVLSPTTIATIDAVAALWLAEALEVSAESVNFAGSAGTFVLRKEGMAAVNSGKNAMVFFRTTDGELRENPFWVSGMPQIGSLDSDLSCPASEKTVVLPVIAGIISFLVAVAAIFYCGREQVGATLFEQTAKAERSAQVAMREAEVKVGRSYRRKLILVKVIILG